MELNYKQICYLLVLVATGLGMAHGQVISTDVSNIVMTADSSGSVQSQQIIVSASSPLVLSVSVTTYATGNWLYASPTTVQTTPGTIIVSASAAGLASGIYNGAILISATGATNSPVSIPVSLSVGNVTPGNTGLASSPTSLSFSGQAGGVPPAAQILNITSTPPGLTFSATSTTSDNGSWLQVSSTITTAPASIVISVNSAGMTAGSYSGSVTFTPTSGTAVTVPVSLTLGGSSNLAVNVSGLQFFYQSGWFLPTYQSFTVTTTGNPLAFSIVTSTKDGNPWLSASPLSGSTSQTITVSVSPGSLGQGTYTGKVTISAPSSLNASIEIPVTLTISTSPLLTATAAPAPFVYQTGGSTPAPQSITIGSTSSQVGFSVTSSTTDGNQWLGVSPLTGATPQNLIVSVNPIGLSPGTYTGTVNVASSAVANSPLRIPITMTITTSSAITLNLQALSFNYQINGANQVYSQTVGVYSTGVAVPVNVAVSMTSCGGNWLKTFQTSVTTPAVVTVGIEPLFLQTPAMCQGVVTFIPAGGGDAVALPVTVTVATTPLLNVTPAALTFTAPFGGDQTVAQTLSLSMTDNSAASYTVQANTTTGGSWITLDAGSGTTPGTITVSANPSTLGVGNYSGNLLIGAAALGTTRLVPVTLKVTATESVTASQTSLSFVQAANGPSPAPQNITIASSKGSQLSYVVSTSTLDLGTWLSVSPYSGNTPASLAVAVNGATLAPGIYQGTVTVAIPAASNSPITIAVKLTVTSAQTISASPSALTFTYRQGGAVPATQTIAVTSNSGAVSVSASASSSGNWLSVAPAASGSSNFVASVSPSALTANQTYNGSITFTAAGVSSVTVPVVLSVLPPASASISQISNAASGVRGAISPGEIVTLLGVGLGPAAGVTLSLTQAGTVDTTLAGTRVFFDEYPAPLLYVSAGQVNAIVPYEVSGRQVTQVAVEYQGVRSQSYTMQVTATAPGIFTVTQNGQGQGAILNQDNGYNASTLPAARGSVVQVFGTGEGILSPTAQTGSVTSGIFKPAANVTATIGDLPATVTFAGAAPGQVAGLFQVNIVVPQNAPTGDAAIQITIGANKTQSGVTVAVK